MVTIEDAEESPVPDQPVQAPRLPIAFAVVRFSYYDPNQFPNFALKVGKRVAIFDEVDSWHWLGQSQDNGSPGRFPFLYVLREGSDEFKIGSQAEGCSEPLEELNNLVTKLFKIEQNDMFGDMSNPRTIFRVLLGLPKCNLAIYLQAFAMVVPKMAQWLSLLYIEYQSFRTLLRSNWVYSSYALTDESGFDGIRKVWPVILETVTHGSIENYRWKALLKYLRTSVPTCEVAWRHIEVFSADPRLLDEFPEIELSLEKTNIVIGLLVDALTKMEKTEKEVRQKWAEDAALSARLSQSSSDGESSLHRKSTTQLEANTKVRQSHLSFHIQNARASTRAKWDKSLKAIGEPKGVMYTVTSLTIVGAITTAVAIWKCSPPDSFPTTDSNFFSTLASSCIGTAGLFCTIIPILRGTKVQVNNIKLFHQLLWASWITAVGAALIYLYQTRASLGLLFLSNAAQLVTTLQIINGAVSKIQFDEGEISSLQSELRRERRNR